MAARSLGLAATFGLAANAFLLPPVLTHDSKEPMDIATWVLVDPQSQPIIAPCQGCEKHDSGPMNLFLNISTGSQPGTLELGGQPFYPRESQMHEPSNTPEAQVVPEEVTLFDIASAPETYTKVALTQWSFQQIEVQQSEPMSERGEELLVLNIRVDMVDQESVFVPNIRVTVLKDPEVDVLTILGARVFEDDEAPQRHEVGQENKPACETALCQWRQFIEDKVHGIAASAHDRFGSGRPFGGRPCPGKMNGMMKDGKPHGPPAFVNMHHGPNSYHHRPLGGADQPHPPFGHPEFHQGPHHAHHKLHHFIHRVGRVIMSILAPILIGIAAGIFAYAVGMVVGCAIGLIWVAVFRGGKKVYASLAQAEDEAAAKEAEIEAESRTSFESAPPVYEDAPAYEEKQVV